MKSYLFVLITLLSFNTIVTSQVNVTDIQYDTHNNRIIPKKVAGIELMLLITPDDSLLVYELNNEDLILKDRKFYPRLFNSSLWSLFSENFLLTRNAYGSIAYDLRSFNEFIIPYEDNHDNTYWYTAKNDRVYLQQENNDTAVGKFVNLNTQSITLLEEGQYVKNQTDNFIQLRNSTLENEYKYIVVNLATQDSFQVVINNPSYYDSAMNEDYFVYQNDGKINKVDISDFSSQEIMTIPTDHTFRSLFLVDNYIVTLSYDSNFRHEITVFNEDNEVIVNLDTPQYMNIVYDHVINDHIVFSGQYSNFSTLNLNDGTINIDTFNYSNYLYDLNEDYLIEYDEEYLYFISKNDLQVVKKHIGALDINYNGIASMEHNGDYIFSLDTYFEGDKQLFSFNGNDIERVDLFDENNSGIPRYSRIYSSLVNEQLILSEDNMYAFDRDGYYKLNEFRIPELTYLTSKILTDNKICWPEVNNDSKYLIKCFEQDQVINYGEIPNVVHSETEIGMTSFTESNGDILYLKYNDSHIEDHELRIKKRDSNVDSLIRLIPYDFNFLIYKGIPFLKVSDYFYNESTLFTFDFSTYTLHDLNFTTTTTTSIYNFAEINGEIYYHDHMSVFKINGIESELIFQSDTQYINDIKAANKYLNISTSASEIYYYENDIFEITYDGESLIHYLDGNFVGFSPGYFQNINYIQNIKTQEEYQLPAEFLDNNITHIISTKQHPIVISIKQIDGIYHIVFNSCDENFSEFSQLYSYPINNPYPRGTKVIYEEDITIAFLDNQVTFINNETGTIVDNITVIGIGYTSQATYKDGILYFIKFDSQLGRQVFMYEPVISKTEEAYQSNFTLYPNPTSNNMKIESDKPFEAWRILTIDGQQLLGNEIKTTKTDIDLTSLNSGFYIIEIISNGRKQTRKFFKL